MVASPSQGPSVAIAMVLHDSADDLSSSLPALVDQLREGDQLWILDNASGDTSADVAARLAPGATVLRSDENLGFAGGVNRALEHATAELLMLLNPDAVLLPGALDILRDAAARHPEWAAWQALVALDDGETVNTSGNLVHWLGFGWSGGLDARLSEVGEAEETVGFSSGAALVVRRADWELVGGFEPRYFMYGEDLDLGLRLRLAGRESGVVPSAVVEHGYEFIKGDYKWFHLERNRWWTVLGTYPGRILVPLLPALLVFELALLPVAWRGGWLRPKLRAQAAVLRELPAILARRRRTQELRRATDREFAAGLTSSLDSPLLSAARAIPFAETLQRQYWALVLRTLR